jgi:hypothetical protein
MTLTRRQFAAGVTAMLMAASGCQRETYANTTPEEIGLEVTNQLIAEIDIVIRIQDGSETVETYDLRLEGDETYTQPTDLQGKEYDVVVEYTERPDGKPTTSEHEWIWGACDTDAIVVTILNDGTRVGRACSDD